MSKPRRALVWLRRDLRLHDASALSAATAEFDEVVMAFIFDTVILEKLTDRNDRHVSFIYDSLAEVREGLRAHGSDLVVRHADPAEETPRLAKELGCEAVFAGRDYDPYALKRDATVAKALGSEGRRLELVQDHLILEPHEVLTGEGKPFRVYTPFSNAWRQRFERPRDAYEAEPNFERLVKGEDLRDHLKPLSLPDLGFEHVKTWLEPGEKAGRKQLDDFRDRIADYAKKRNFPAIDATSALSVHFRFGTVSMREAVRTALSSESQGADKWLGELIWREFYQSILFHWPEVVREPFQDRYRGIEYPGSESHFMIWCEGQTGYPIVDAAMRCFNATGWMHNRLRMVVASFLTKDLLVDYRKGETYFARFLLDFELASNNGGWQWAASVGCDPQPYFRIFNPVLQSEKFDPDGAFIREWVPELSKLEGAALHAPWKASAFDLLAGGVELGKTYPKPIVDHAEQRAKAIALLSGR